MLVARSEDRGDQQAIDEAGAFAREGSRRGSRSAGTARVGLLLEAADPEAAGSVLVAEGGAGWRLLRPEPDGPVLPRRRRRTTEHASSTPLVEARRRAGLGAGPGQPGTRLRARLRGAQGSRARQ